VISEPAAIAEDFALGMELADRKAPKAVNARSKEAFEPGAPAW